MSATEDFAAHTVPEVEVAILAACMFDPKAASYALPKIRLDHFTAGPLRQLLRAIQIVTSEGGLPHIPAVIAQMMDQGCSHAEARATVIGVGEQFVTAANQEFYVRILIERWFERVELEVAQAIASNGHGGAEQDALRQRVVRAKEERDRLLAPTVERFVPVPALELIEKTLPPVEELVSPRIIYRGGVTVMVASHKRGKSLAALGLCVDLVLHVANPMLPDEDMPRWLGQIVLGSGPVLVYSAEGGERMIQERLRKMCPRREGGLSDLFVYAQTPAPQLDRTEDIDAVFAHAERVGAVLLVFDPLGRFWAMEEEGDPTAARNLMLAIQVRAERAYAGRGIAVLIIHHDTKSSGADEESAVTGGRGSGKFGDDADALINLKIVPSGEPGESVAKFLLRHAESPAPVPVKIDRDSLRLVVKDDHHDRRVGAAKGGRPPKLSLGALENLIQDRGRIEGARVADELGVAFPTWEKNRRRMVAELVEMGKIEITTLPGSQREVFVWVGPAASETSETSHW